MTYLGMGDRFSWKFVEFVVVLLFLFGHEFHGAAEPQPNQKADHVHVHVNDHVHVFR